MTSETIQLRFDLSPAQLEGAIREHLIRLGWTPPGEHVLTNPWTGKPRDYRDVDSDPEGVLCVEPGAPLKAATSREVAAWRVPVRESSFGEWLDHGIHDALVLVVHRDTHGWKAAGLGNTLLAHQVYVKNVEPLCVSSHEIAVVGLFGGGWRTVWARSDDDVTHPVPEPKQPDAGLDMEAILRWFLTEDGYIAECDIKHIVAALTSQLTKCSDGCPPQQVCDYCQDHWPKQPAAVDDMVVERIAALLHEEELGEPWDATKVEHPGPHRNHYRKLASKVVTILTQQPAEQHPDDAAVDRFATVMKAKLTKKRQEGRGGWESMSSKQLSALLHEHVRKGDPVDVANLAMMLHQNVQVIEPDEMVKELREALKELISWIPSADIYRRMGFNPEAPMRAFKRANDLLSKVNNND